MNSKTIIKATMIMLILGSINAIGHLEKHYAEQVPDTGVEEKPEPKPVVPMPDVDIYGCETFSGSTCSKCYIGHALVAGKCEKCHQGCKVCESKDKCTEAFIGYRVYKGKTFPCDDGCKKCDENDECQECLLGTYQYKANQARKEAQELKNEAGHNGYMLKKLSHAQDDDDEDDESINKDYISLTDHEDGECVKCPKYCKKCNSVKCLECVDNQLFKISNSGRRCIDMQLKKFKFLALFVWLFLSSMLVFCCCCCVCSCACGDYWLMNNCIDCSKRTIQRCSRGDKINERKDK